MSFALVTDDVLVTWEDGKVQGFPAEALVDAELALRRGAMAATPTGPWFEQGTPEAAYLALRKLWPHSEVEGDPPKIGPYGDELEGAERIEEADYKEVLHPRDRRGRWRKKELGFAQMIRQTMSMKAAHVTGTQRRRAESGGDPLPGLHYVGFDQMVLKHGLLFKHGPNVTPTEREYSATTAKECFLNATHAALEHRDLTYVEGFAYNGILPIHHAWLVDEDGVVHDPTWASMQGREGDADIYIGIPFKTDWLLRHLAEKETYGVYGEWGEGLKLTEPVPEDAIETGVKGLPVPKKMQDPDPEIMGWLTKARDDYEKRQEPEGMAVEKELAAPKLPLGPSEGFVAVAERQWSHIKDKLAPRFEDDPDFAHLVERLGEPRGFGSIRSYTISAGSNPPATPTQMAVDEVWTSWIGTDKAGLYGPLLVAAGQEFGIDTPVDLDEKGREWTQDEAAMRALRKYLRAVHEDTQDYLRGQGITHLRLYRGLVFEDENPFRSGPGVHEIESAPLTSWSDDYDFSYLFTTGITGAGDGTNGAMLRLDVPAERVLGLPSTGLGDWLERVGSNELVILGGTDEAEVIAWHPPGLTRDVTEQDFETMGSDFQGTTQGRGATVPEHYGQGPVHP